MEDDVAARLREEARRRRTSLKQVVNEALRRGLEPGERKRPRFRVAAQDLGLRPGMELDDIAGTLERLEGPRYR